MCKLGKASLALALVLAAGRPLRADDQAAVRAVLDRAIKATGGEANLAKVRAVAMKFKGKVYFNDNPLDFTGELATQFPDRQKLTVSVEAMGQTFTVVRVVDGNKGWVKEGDGKTRPMSKDEVAEEKEQMYARSLAHLVQLKGKAFRLSPLGDVEVGKHQAVGIKVSHKGHRDVNLYFDKKTGLLLKSETNVKNPATDTEVSQEIFYEDYKKADGIRRPGKMKVKQDGKNLLDIDEMSDVRVEEKLDDSDFAKP